MEGIKQLYIYRTLCFHKPVVNGSGKKTHNNNNKAEAEYRIYQTHLVLSNLFAHFLKIAPCENQPHVTLIQEPTTPHTVSLFRLIEK